MEGFSEETFWWAHRALERHASDLEAAGYESSARGVRAAADHLLLACPTEECSWSATCGECHATAWPGQKFVASGDSGATHGPCGKCKQDLCDFFWTHQHRGQRANA